MPRFTVETDTFLGGSSRLADYRKPFAVEATGDEWLDGFLQNAIKLRPVRDTELLRVREQLEGGKKAIGEKYFPRPDGMDPKKWQRYRRLITHINLVRPSVRAWSDAVYSGENTREITAGDESGELQDWLDSPEYEELVDAWNEQAIAYGFCVAVPQYDPDTDEEVGACLYDPLYTYIFTSKADVFTTEAVVEVTPSCIRYVTLKGSGFITRTKHVHYEADYDELPVAIAYGEDRRHQGNPYGGSLCLDSVEHSIAATETTFNVRILQKIQTRSLLIIIADDDAIENDGDGWGPEKVMRYRQNAEAQPDAKFITPQPLIDETIKVLKTMVGMYGCSNSLPLDVLDPTLVEAAQSAEAARIRAIPLVHRSKRMVKRWRANEVKLILVVAAVKQYVDDGKKVRVSQLKKTLKVNVQLNPVIIPQSLTELVGNLIQMLGAGLITPEQALQMLWPLMGRDAVKKMADEIRARAETAKEAAQVADAAVKKQTAAVAPAKKPGEPRR